MNIYHYQPVTGRFLGMGQADPDPLNEGAFIFPAYCTQSEPPSVAIGFFAKFENGAWVTVAEPAPEPEPPQPTAAEIKAANIKKIDADVDLIYMLAIGNRATEYAEAEKQAQTYKDAGYTGTIPTYVASWLSSNTKSLTTAQQATDDILAQATAWRGAAAAMRANRLSAKKNASTDVSTAMAQWNGFVTAIRGQLGV
jgi:hypothetical protein